MLRSIIVDTLTVFDISENGVDIFPASLAQDGFDASVVTAGGGRKP